MPFMTAFDRRLRSLIAAATCAAALVAAAPAALAADTPLYGPVAASPVKGGTLNVGLLTEPPALDPFHQAADARIAITVLMYQGLFYEGPGGEAVPLLAESYKVSDDGLTYTIKLRQGVKFHDGKAMTAKDVVYSYNYLRDPKNGSPGASDLSMVDSIAATDDSTITVKLKTPNASLPMTLGNKYGGVVPDGYFASADAQNKMNAVSVGTGPFKLAEFNKNSNIKLVRNDAYWGKDLPYLDAVNFVIVPNGASMLVALRNHRIDLATLNRPQYVQMASSIPGVKIEKWPSLNQKAIDLGSELKPLDDVKVRQAIALAVDKAEMMKAAVGEDGRVIGTMVAAMQDKWGLPLAEVPNQKPDIERAKALLKEAGHADGFDLTLTTINGYDWMDPAAVTLRQELSKIGIRLNIKKVDLGVWVNGFRSHNMGFTFNDWATQPDPNLLFYRHFHMRPEGADFRNWNNKEASDLLDQGRAENDPAKRKAIYDKFQKILAETAPTIMLFSPDLVTVRSDKVMNYVGHPTGWYYGVARTYLAK